MPDPVVVTQSGIIIEHFDGKPIAALRDGSPVPIEEIIEEGAFANRQTNIWEGIKDACRDLLLQHFERHNEKSLEAETARAVYYAQKRRSVDAVMARRQIDSLLDKRHEEVPLLSLIDLILDCVATWDRDKITTLFPQAPLLKETTVSYVRFHDIPKVFVPDV